jgi:hypothetical protein
MGRNLENIMVIILTLTVLVEALLYVAYLMEKNGGRHA